MKKNVLKKPMKLHIHRETLRALEEPQLLKAYGGTFYGHTTNGHIACFEPASFCPC